MISNDCFKKISWDSMWKNYDSNQRHIWSYKACDMEPDGSNVRAFIAKYEANQLEPYIKSEIPPVSNDGPVKVWLYSVVDSSPIM